LSEDAAEPEPYRGVIIIEWPPRGPSPYHVLNGRQSLFLDAVTGKPIMTVSEADIIVHTGAESRVTATLTMFADEAGEPILDGNPVVKDGEVLTGVFPFLVSEMRVRPA
jgi:hypothetical protein